jgi:hypothetical protein
MSYTPIKMTKVQNTNDTKCWQGCGAERLSFIAGGVHNDTPTLEDSVAVSNKTKHTPTI